MASVSINITGWDKVVAKYGPQALDGATKHALSATTVYGADLVKAKLTSHVVTGFLHSSIVGQVTSDSTGKTYARPGSGVYYAKFVETGTGIYGPKKAIIKPKLRKAMAWHPTTFSGAPVKGPGGKGKANKIVRKSVKGQKPVQMFHHTFLQDKPKLQSKFQTAFRSNLGLT